jgi:ferredoxin-NADP reductase
MPECQITLVRRQIIARDNLAFWFDANDATYQFRAGQHADFAFFQTSPDHELDNSRTFSLANSPVDRQIMIALRIRETAFKAALKAAPLGTKFKVSRPRGSFTLHKDAKRPAVFLAGGIGIMPMRSILHWAAQERLPHKLYLFYSNRHLEDAAFLEELEDLATQNPCFRFIPTLTGVESAAWHYERGPIDHSLLARYLGGLSGPVYYAAGPSGMVAAMESLLHGSGVSNDDIKTEEFGDYSDHQSSSSVIQEANHGEE